MKKLPLIVLIVFAMGTLLCSNPTAAQLLPPAKKVVHVQITEGPELESTHDTQAIIRWTSNNPGGSDEHHSYTVFRVRALELKPHTNYYYKVDSEDASGISDGVRSTVRTFKTE